VILYAGKIVEAGPTDDVFAPPHHPYTEALLSAVPRVGRSLEDRTLRLEGPLPDPAAPPRGCPFHPRCPRRIGPICEEQEPPVIIDERGHAIMCHISPAALSKIQASALPG
jgi:peptide/nickel transport system ATP-binding protein